MKGFILSLRKARNEDIILTLLERNAVRDYYRFYGARHSILQLGYLIDYEEEQGNTNFMPRLRHVAHIGFPWLYERERLMLWHRFIQLFAPHLKDVEHLESFYFDMLLDAAKKWHKQNPKRLICESYIKLLQFEGRLHHPLHCTICNGGIGENVSLMHAFLPAHPECIHGPGIQKVLLEKLYSSKSTCELDDTVIEQLYPIVLKGL